MTDLYLSTMNAMNAVERSTCIKFTKEDIADEHVIRFTLRKKRYRVLLYSILYTPFCHKVYVLCDLQKLHVN